MPVRRALLSTGGCQATYTMPKGFIRGTKRENKISKFPLLTFHHIMIKTHETKLPSFLHPIIWRRGGKEKKKSVTGIPRDGWEAKQTLSNCSVRVRTWDLELIPTQLQSLQSCEVLHSYFPRHLHLRRPVL